MTALQLVQTPNGPGLLLGQSPDGKTLIIQHQLEQMPTKVHGTVLTAGAIQGVWAYPVDQVTSVQTPGMPVVVRKSTVAI